MCARDVLNAGPKRHPNGRHLGCSLALHVGQLLGDPAVRYGIDVDGTDMTVAPGVATLLYDSVFGDERVLDLDPRRSVVKGRRPNVSQ